MILKPQSTAFPIFAAIISCVGCASRTPTPYYHANNARPSLTPSLDHPSSSISQSAVTNDYDETGNPIIGPWSPHRSLGDFTFYIGRIWWTSRIDQSRLSQSSDSDRGYRDGDRTNTDHLLLSIQVEYNGQEPAYLPRITILDGTQEPLADVLGKPIITHEIEPESIGYFASDGASSVQRLSYGPPKVFILPFAPIIGHKNLSLKFVDRDGMRSALLPLEVPDYHLERHSRY